MTDKNTYAAVAVNSFKVPRRRRWLQWFVILNAMLSGLPLSLAIAVYAMLAVNGVQISGSSGILGMQTAFVVAGYVVLPNIIMAMFWTTRRPRRSNANRL